MSLTAPAMAFLGLIGLIWTALYAMGLTKRWGILVPIWVMFVVSAMSLPVDWSGRLLYTVWLPIQSRRSMIFFAAGIAATVVLLLQLRRLSGKRVSPTAVMLVVMGYYAALLRTYHDGVAQGAESIVFATVTLLPLLFAAALTMDTPEQVRSVLRMMALMSMVWVFMCVVQFFANSGYLTTGNESRFVGLMSNPQHAGALLSFMAVTLLWLTLNDRWVVLRPFYIVTLGAVLLMLAWTGSRTGLGMAAIGFAAVLYTRMGKAILFLPVILAVAYYAFKAVLSLTGSRVGLERLASTDDTRSHAWATLIRVGMDNPMLGAGIADAETSENSWLYGFAAFGIGMLVLAILMTIVGGVEFIKRVRQRSRLPLAHRRILDLSLGVFAMYFAGAVLEGYMISRVSPALCFFMIYAGIAASMARFATQGVPQAEYLDDAEEADWALDEPGGQVGEPAYA
ncbi:MAG: hypothetical protein LAT64_04690 [Phycisphaerales bacterium]|nr:hypothetical protein [Planctomycetota bacterium]MCH8508051.1 hypothetical protein [Phycisphaerales bacterium]